MIARESHKKATLRDKQFEGEVSVDVFSILDCKETLREKRLYWGYH